MATVACILAVFAVICIGLPNTSTDAKGTSKRLNSKSKFSDTIDIDNTQYNGHRFIEGSGTDRGDDDGDDSDIFGNIDVGSGAFESSGDQLPVSRSSTKCLQLLNSMNSQRQPGLYVPRCTSSGEFAPVQCNGGTDECWCADKHGQLIPGTKRRAPDSPNCKKFISHRKNPAILDTRTTRPPSKTTARTTRSFAPTLTPPRQQIVVVMATKSNSIEQNNRIDQMPPYDIDMNGINIVLPDINSNEIEPPLSRRLIRSPITSQPGILAGIISAAVVSLLCTVLLVMFVIYRLRKKHEQELYVVDKPKMGPVLNYANHCSDAYG